MPYLHTDQLSSNRMRLSMPVIAMSLILFSSCRLTEEALVGTYRPKGNSQTRLQLKPDGLFELALLDPVKDSLIFPGADGHNFFTTGSWKLNGKNRIILRPNADPRTAKAEMVEDSIARFTHISSFNFWNRFGEPVPIRYILIPPSRPKPHFGNSLYFFAQDFNPKDTLKFFFDGYASVNYPGTIPGAIGNNMHKVTLHESFLPAAFDQMALVATRRTMKSTERKLGLIKSNR